jgi:glycosyltransferase involved in cell wall biosynthesis
MASSILEERVGATSEAGGGAASDAAADAGRRRRVLYFAPKVFWPPDTGAKLRNYHLARQLALTDQVTYLGFAVPDVTPSAPPPERVCDRVIAVPRDRGYTVPNLVRGILGRTPLPILNYTTEPMAAALERALADDEHDLVQIEGVHLLGYLPRLRAAKGRPVVVCDWHNVESELMSRYGERAAGVLKRLYARSTARRLRDAEREALTKLEAHVVVSERDREHLLSLAPSARVFVVENGVDVAHFADDRLDEAHRSSALKRAGGAAPERKRLLFVGSMDYHANIDAATHFVAHGWRALRARRPGYTLTLVGRNPPAEVRALAAEPGVEVTGTVADVRPYYREAACAVVPLRVGGGSRLKILEAMAAGVPVVSTHLGAEGLLAEDGVHLLIGDTPEALVRALEWVVGSEELRAKLVASGRDLVRARYDWAAQGQALRRVHDALLSARERVFQVLAG